jgi:gas vesicle protein
MSSNSSGSSAFSWFLAGLGMGSLLGVLYAPRPGQETREDLLAGARGSGESVKKRASEVTRVAGDYVERGKGQAADYVSRGKEQATQYANAGKSQVSDYVDRGKDAVETGRQKINEVYNQGRQTVAEQKEKLSASLEAGKQAYVSTSVPPLPQEELIPGTKQSS